MSQDKRALLRQRLESGQLRLHPLTFPQRELWEDSPVQPVDPANHICCLIEARGRITPEDGAGALQQVVQRQEVLRASFLPGKDGPMQLVREDASARMRFRELKSSECSAEAVEAIASEIFREPFDLVQGPLYRVELLRRAPDDHVMVFSIHHAIGDGWTLGLFVEQLCLAYIQRVRGIQDPLPPLPQTYSAWGGAERAFWTGAEIESRLDFWKTHLSSPPRLWNHKEGPHSAAGAHCRLVSHFPPELAGAVRDLARRFGATLFSTLLAAFRVAFSRWSGCDDVLIGAPVANRNRANTKETMGYFAGIVPVRGRVDPTRTFAATLNATHASAVECFANALPFAELARAVGERTTPGHPPLFEVRFALQNHPIPDVALPGLSAKLRMRSTGTARFHIGCEITEEGDQLEVVWLFRPEMLARTEMERLGRMFREVLTQACDSPEKRVADFSLSVS